MKQLVGPPCLHCGLVTFTDRCNLMAYGLEETTIEGYALECFMCKSRGPWARTPEEAIQRYSPWVAFNQRPPLDGQKVILWDVALNQVDLLNYRARIPAAYETAQFTYWAPPLPDPATYLRVTEEVPEVQPSPEPFQTEETAELTAEPCKKHPDCWLQKDHEGECDTMPF